MNIFETFFPMYQKNHLMIFRMPIGTCISCMFSSLSQANNLPQYNGFDEMSDKALVPTVTLPGKLF